MERTLSRVGAYRLVLRGKGVQDDGLTEPPNEYAGPRDSLAPHVRKAFIAERHDLPLAHAAVAEARLQCANATLAAVWGAKETIGVIVNEGPWI